MTKVILSIIFFAVYFLSFSQQGDGGVPQGFQSLEKSVINLPIISFSQPDIKKLRSEDKINDSLQNGPWRFGYNYTTSLGFYSGTWETLPNGDAIWLLRINAEKAETINLAFSNTFIPEGNELYVYNPSKTFILGKFTQKHIYKGELGTELVPGETVIVEYFVPKENINNKGNIEISTVTYGYRTAKEYQEKAFGSSGNCNMNVNCPDGLPYKNQRNSVVMLVVGNSGFCTGTLINNTEYDGKPYVLTANHCFSSNLASWLFRFKWQGDGCSNPASSPSFESLSGAELKARRTPTDFCLVEIKGGLSNGTVPQNCDPYFSGWNRSDEAPASVFSIHHPSGDIKKISFCDKKPLITQVTIGQNTSEPNGVWRVLWDRNTVTEGGSSGASLFNNYGQIIGQLWGGQSTCGNAGTPDAFDFFGRFNKSWEPAQSMSGTQLKYWLDPNNKGNNSISGFNPYEPVLNTNAVALSVDYKDDLCASSYIPNIEIQNKGVNPLTSLTIKYTYNGASPQTVTWSGSLNTFETEMVQLPMIYNVNGLNQIDIELLNPNGQTDGDMSDNSIQVTYQANINGAALDFEFSMGCWPEENSWELKDAGGNIIYSGGNYPTTGGNIEFTTYEEFCLPNGCYELTLKDQYGDGVAGAMYSTCDYNGSMTLYFPDYNEILAQMLESESNFGYSKTFNFCIEKAGIENQYLEDKVNVFPNPSAGKFTIEMNFQGEKNIILTDLSGRVVVNFQTEKMKLELDKTELSLGVYLMTMFSKKGKITKKIILE